MTPNGRNVIPGQVVFTAGLRSPDIEILHSMKANFPRRAAEACEELDLDFSSQLVGAYEPPRFDDACVGAVRTAETLGYDWREIVSGASHDATLINTVVPSAIIMCPCVDGFSHNEAEEI
ncbi:hypothetical protein A3731_18155 [Roseovarius sp. HI0049]|nr:hypothetical protein A3731_18155 [Roseovarius sp. HI0049]